MSVWEKEILESIKSLDGKAKPKQVCERLYGSPSFRQLLTKKHLRITWDRPAYYHQIRRRMVKLRRDGELKQILLRQPYSLNEKGIKRIEIEKKKINTRLIIRIETILVKFSHQVI